MRRLLFSCLILLALDAEAAVSDINRIYHETPTLQGFDVCSGGGCFDIKRISLSTEEWQKVAAIFNPTPNNAEQERKQISLAVGKLEELVGIKAGTSTDRAGTFDNSSYPGQLDCNDEAINTTTYMRLLYSHGLIKLHEIEDMRTRNFFFTGWPHTTAVIHEIATGHRFAVDSWFYDNGVPATIIPFEQWKSGYVPDDSPIKHTRSAHKPNEAGPSTAQ
ncbi:MAG TPA: hypothetical protein VK949_01715 [Methylotenera sp.]|nr:hypothetical protein [Methylotenera sp.]